MQPQQFRQAAPPQYAAHQVQQRAPHPGQRRGQPGSMVPAPMQPGMANRPPAGMPAPTQPPQMAHDHPDNEALMKERAKRRRDRKPNDKNLPDGVDDCVTDPDVARRYRELRDLERRLDATMTRKRLDTMEAVSRETKHFKTLRIWINNTVEDQAWQNGPITADTFDLSSNNEASYRVKIEGRVLDDAEDAQATKDSAAEGKDDGDNDATAGTKDASSASPKYRFSHFFRQMSVDFERNPSSRPPAEPVTWSKPESKARQPSGTSTASDFDELCFKRNGDSNMNITINLYRSEEPERQSLSPPLASIVGAEQATLQDATLAVWEYINLNGLQEDEEKRNFRCDELLGRAFGREVGKIPELEQYVAPHLGAAPPVSLEYTIRVDEEFHKNPEPTVYDVQVAVDDPVRAMAIPLITAPAYGHDALNEIRDLDGKLVTLMGAVADSKAHHQFLSALSQDPVIYLRNWLSSQKRDLDVITGEAPRGTAEDPITDEWRRGGKDSVWASENAREGVNSLLSRGMR